MIVQDVCPWRKEHVENGEHFLPDITFYECTYYCKLCDNPTECPVYNKYYKL